MTWVALDGCLLGSIVVEVPVVPVTLWSGMTTLSMFGGSGIADVVSIVSSAVPGSD